MKKTVFISLLVLLCVSFSACNSNNPISRTTIDLVVSQNQWSYDEGVNAYICRFTVPELTANVYNYSEISISREYNRGTVNAYQVVLPETSYKVEYEYDELGNITNTFYYQQHIDYAVGIGFVEVMYTISDFFYPEGSSPEAMLFRMQITY